MERDGKSEEEARNRLASQMSNQEVVDQSNLVFCTQWEPEYTQKQVAIAWAELAKILDI